MLLMCVQSIVGVIIQVQASRILSDSPKMFPGLYGRHCICQVHDAHEQGRDHHFLQGYLFFPQFLPKHKYMPSKDLFPRTPWSQCEMELSTSSLESLICAWSTLLSATSMDTSLWRWICSVFRIWLNSYFRKKVVTDEGEEIPNHMSNVDFGRWWEIFFLTWIDQIGKS